MIKKRHSVLFSLVLLNIFSYSFMSIYENTLQLHLTKSHTNTEIGILISCGSAVVIFASLIWGVIADKSKYKNTVHIAVTILSAISFVLIGVFKGFNSLIILIPLFCFFLAPTPGLCDTISLQSCKQYDVKYGSVRVFASLIYGLIPFLVLFFDIKIIFPLYAVLAVLLCITHIFVPKTRGESHKKQNFSLKPLFSDKNLLILLIFVLMMNLTWYFHQTFFSIYITSELGMDNSVWGYVALITIIGELPLFIFFDKIFKRGIKNILLISVFFIAARFIILSYAKSLPLILTVALLTGFAPTSFTYCVTYYIDKHADEKLKTSGITLIYSVAAVPRIIGFLFGGMLTESLTTPVVMRLAAALWMIPLVIYFIKIRPDKTGAYS